MCGSCRLVFLAVEGVFCLEMKGAFLCSGRGIKRGFKFYLHGFINLVRFAP